MTQAFRFVLGQVCTGKYKVTCRRIPHNQNGLNSMHWGERARWNTAWHDEIRWRFVEQRAAYFKSGGKLPLIQPRIKFKFYVIHELDQDNLRSACKPLLDAMKIKNGLGIIVDDSPAHIPEPVYQQVRVSHRMEEHVEIQITSRKASPPTSQS